MRLRLSHTCKQQTIIKFAILHVYNAIFTIKACDNSWNTKFAKEGITMKPMRMPSVWWKELQFYYNYLLSQFVVVFTVLKLCLWYFYAFIIIDHESFIRFVFKSTPNYYYSHKDSFSFVLHQFILKANTKFVCFNFSINLLMNMFLWINIFFSIFIFY